MIKVFGDVALNLSEVAVVMRNVSGTDSTILIRSIDGIENALSVSNETALLVTEAIIKRQNESDVTGPMASRLVYGMDRLKSESCEATVVCFGNSYAIQAYPTVDTGCSVEQMFVGFTFEIVNGKYAPISIDEWNRRVGTHGQESSSPMLSPHPGVPETLVETTTQLPGQRVFFGDDRNPEPATDIEPAKQDEDSMPTE